MPRLRCGYGRGNAKRIAEYIRRQLQEDKIANDISMKEYIDPFTGLPTNKGKEKRPLRTSQKRKND